MKSSSPRAKETLKMRKVHTFDLNLVEHSTIPSALLSYNVHFTVSTLHMCYNIPVKFTHL